MIFALLMVLCGANVGCMILDAYYHPWMIFINLIAALACLVGAIRALD